MNIPTISHYCPNTTASNATCVSLGDLDLYFSYRTPVAFRYPGIGTVVRQNEWGPTTGKHLNAIDGGDKKSRVPGDEFIRLLNTLTPSEV